MQFTATKDEDRIIRKIVRRAEKLGVLWSMEWDAMSLAMDITATHSNGCPLDLQRFLDAPSFDFVHDVAGIVRHLDRETGKLTDHFTPRSALPQQRRLAPIIGTARVE